MKDSNISWTDHTFNPWEGCTKVSPACQHCYAETLVATRYKRVEWGPGKPRRRTSEANWKKPLAWNREAEKTGVRPRVFCASLADWLDDEVPIEWLADLLALIYATPNLDWLQLSKRPHLFAARVQGALVAASMQNNRPDVGSWLSDWLDGSPPRNVWIGATVENQEWAEKRIPALLSIPARVRFLSCEPLLGPLNLDPFCLPDKCGMDAGDAGIHWVIAGGESGHGARPSHPDWFRSLRDQCVAAGVAFHFKQWGEHDERGERVGKRAAGRLLDGREWNEFPGSLQTTK